MALPQGALEELLGEGGTAAFDAAVEADRAATAKMFDAAKTNAEAKESETEAPEPTLAENQYNRSRQSAPAPKPADADAAADATAKSKQTPNPGLDLVETPIEEIRELAGVSIVERLPAQAREQWNPEDEAAALSYFIQEGVPSRVIEKAMLHYADAILYGEPLDQAAKRFHEEFSTTLTKRQRDALVDFALNHIHGAKANAEEGGRPW